MSDPAHQFRYGETAPAAPDGPAPDGAGRLGERGQAVDRLVGGLAHLLVALADVLGIEADSANIQLGDVEVDYPRLRDGTGRVKGRKAHRRPGGRHAGVSLLHPVDGQRTRSDRPRDRLERTAPLAEIPAAQEGLQHAPPAAAAAAPPAAPPVARPSAPPAAPPVDDGSTPWERGVSAARAGEHSSALACFQAEAEVAVREGQHARAAIAYRSAYVAADAIGQGDLADHMLRLAGKHYLSTAEARDTPLRGVRQAYEAAAKCFLQAGNLRLAELSIQRALSLEDVLG